MTQRREPLGNLLVRRMVLEPEQLAHALAHQKQQGGRIGTNLVDLGFVSLDNVARGLVVQSGIAQADLNSLMEVNDAVIALIPRQYAEMYMVFPLKLEQQRLQLAVIDAPNQELLAQMQQSFGYALEPRIVPEVRMRFFLEQRYGIPRPVRFRRLHGGGEEQLKKTRFSESYDSVLSPSSSYPQVKVPPPVPAEDGIMVLPPLGASTPSLPPLPPSIEWVANALEDATTGETVVRALVRPLSELSSLNILFWVRDDHAVGCYVYGGGPSQKPVDRLQISLENPSLLQWAYTHRSVARGSAVMDSLQGRLATYFQASQPEEAIVVPVTMNHHVINLLCLQTAKGNVFPQRIEEALKTLSDIAERAYMRLSQSL